MFAINNQFEKDSLDWHNSGKKLGERYEEVLDLQAIYDDCIQNEEKWECDMNALYEVEVESGVAFWEWLYSSAGESNYELRELVMRMVAQILTDFQEKKPEKIKISLGEFDGCVCNKNDYRCVRRKILSRLSNVSDYYEFMKTCFLESEFSNEVKSGLERIDDFPLHVEEITDNLALLNDEAIKIYDRYGDAHEKDAMRELAARALDCSGDPKHKHELVFPFPYSEEGENGPITYIAQITCCPHMKLIRRDSNLRIYFYWRDMRIGEGKKVLIGKIGSHPY